MLRGMKVLLTSGLVLQSYGNTIDCLKNTGGTCTLSSCAETRGDTECTLTKCWCSANTCAFNGACSAGTYTAVGGGAKYKLRSAKWPEYYFDVDTLNTVRVVKEANEDDNDFKVYIAGNDAGNNGRPVFVIASVAFPDSVLMVEDKARNTGTLTAGSDYNLYCRDVSVGMPPSTGVKIKEASWVLNLAKTQSCVPGRIHVYFESSEFPKVFMHLNDLHSFVVTSLWSFSDHPDLEGAFFFDPPLPTDVTDSLGSWYRNCSVENCPAGEETDCVPEGGHDVSNADAKSATFAICSVCIFLAFVVLARSD